MPMVVSDQQMDMARQIRELVAAYDDVEDLVSIGAYKEGTKPIADRAIAKWEAINRFLRQAKAEASDYEETLNSMEVLTGD